MKARIALSALIGLCCSACAGRTASGPQTLTPNGDSARMVMVDLRWPSQLEGRSIAHVVTASQATAVFCGEQSDRWTAELSKSTGTSRSLTLAAALTALTAAAATAMISLVTDESKRHNAQTIVAGSGTFAAGVLAASSVFANADERATLAARRLGGIAAATRAFGIAWADIVAQEEFACTGAPAPTSPLPDSTSSILGVDVREGGDTIGLRWHSHNRSRTLNGYLPVFRCLLAQDKQEKMVSALVRTITEFRAACTSTEFVIPKNSSATTEVALGAGTEAAESAPAAVAPPIAAPVAPTISPPSDPASPTPEAPRQ